jgi:hypothetical protein
VTALAELLESEGASKRESVMPRFVRAIAEDLGAEAASYRHVFANGAHVIEQGVSSDHARMRSYLRRVEAAVPSAPLHYGSFDFFRVAPEEQNAILDQRACRRIMDEAMPYGVRTAYVLLGLVAPSHMRVLFSDPPATRHTSGSVVSARGAAICARPSACAMWRSSTCPGCGQRASVGPT